jgi:peptidoglycan/LPS O-acetylase OafA/YrhL
MKIEAGGFRDNGFTFLRLVAAFLVLVTHSYVLVGAGLDPLVRLTGLIGFSSVGVDSFFAISGFLVCSSLMRQPQPLLYLRNRLLRLLPALAGVVLASVLLVGPLFSAGADYWRDSVTYKYLYTATVYGYHEYLPGVFQGNPVHVVNGSLWTLPLELTCYLLLLALSWCRALNARSLLLLVAVMLVLHLGEAFPPLRFVAQMEMMRLNRFGVLFCGGALLAVLRDRVAYSLPLAGAAFLAITAAVHWARIYQQFDMPYLLLLPYIVITLAYSLKRMAWLDRWDLSYGFYVYAFLVQQCVVARLGAMSPARLTVIATPIVLACALASWLAIERPALALKRARTRQGVAGGDARQLHGEVQG